ncbi:hypothetical protein O4215_20520 [Rhodococcus maanshanensis]|uniref:hypothetical protein n=1 Tax=Rhodococcus maanshanensis TaxID=183556 RepID=UPI0022B3B1C1|nr:hypothetical protein [Rhodococcus maanshanensis]MCZ4557949.1 hypothetical protein [Rhodococcus maanshanensis]
MSATTTDRQRAMVDWFNAAELGPLSAADLAALERLMRWPIKLDVGVLQADEAVRSTIDRIDAKNRAAASKVAAARGSYSSYQAYLDEIAEYSTEIASAWWPNPYLGARDKRYIAKARDHITLGTWFLWLMDEEHTREVATERQQLADSVPARNHVRAYVARRLVEDHLTEARLSAIVDALTGASVTAR